MSSRFTLKLGRVSSAISTFLRSFFSPAMKEKGLSAFVSFSTSSPIALPRSSKRAGFLSAMWLK